MSFQSRTMPCSMGYRMDNNPLCSYRTQSKTFIVVGSAKNRQRIPSIWAGRKAKSVHHNPNQDIIEGACTEVGHAEEQTQKLSKRDPTCQASHQRLCQGALPPKTWRKVLFKRRMGCAVLSFEILLHPTPHLFNIKWRDPLVLSMHGFPAVPGVCAPIYRFKEWKHGSD